MPLIAVAGGEEDPIAAAARFYAEVAPQVLAAADPLTTLLFPPADHAHAGWRAAAVASLARAVAPRRVNAVVGEDTHGEGALASALGFLEAAPGVTGQVLSLDSFGAGAVLA